MGVRGMETFLEKHSNACYPINVTKVIHEYRRQYHSTPVIVIDGMSILRYMYKFRNLSWIYGGQLKEYEKTLRDFIYAFQKEGAELVFFFDGPYVSAKTNTWIKRRLDTLKQVYNMLDDFSRGQRIHRYENGPLFILPANLRHHTIYVAKKCGCKVFSSVRECDLEIAEYAAQNNCMAVLAQDSDFVIYNSAKYYWSMKNFIFHKMTTLNYNRQKLASSLGLEISQLPLLATLLGNDVISFVELASFHQQMLKEKYLKNWTNFPALITEVSNFIRPFPGGFRMDSENLDLIAQRVFSDTSKSSLIQDSLCSYDLSATINKDPGCPLSSDKNWKSILEKVHELHKIYELPGAVYGIIVQLKYSCSTCVEDYRLTDLPANQTVLKPLRRKLYGILLLEKPSDTEVLVEEVVVCGPKSLDEPVFVEPISPKVKHPGLLALWGNNSFHEKWTLVGDIFEVDVEKVKALPPHLIIPALTLNFLQKNVQIEDWEMEAIVSSVVLVQIYDPKYLSAIGVCDTVCNTRPFRLFTLISRSYSTTSLIFQALGNPLPLEMIVATNYQDGKLFHYKYWQVAQHPDINELCDYKEKAVDHFGQLMNFILYKC